jgi:hypothetical protein
MPRASRLDVALVVAWWKRNWLGVWFGTLFVLMVREIPKDAVLFVDARIYLEATKTWLAGGNPWAAPVYGLTFAGPPTTLVPLVPFALLPTDIGVVLLALTCAASAVATVRMMRIPWWWLMFPPMVSGLFNANVQLLLLPLLLAGQGWAAVMIKAYAGVPLLILGRWRELLISVGAVAATVLILPWAEFVAQFGSIAGALGRQSNGSLDPRLLVVLAPVGVLALLAVGRERAAWLAVPALWPSAQPYYATLAIPARSSIAAAIIAYPVTGNGFLALVVLAVTTQASKVLSGRDFVRGRNDSRKRGIETEPSAGALSRRVEQ